MAAVVYFSASAQGGEGRELNMEVFRTISILATLLLFMVFLFSILKLVLDNRLKNKVLEKGVGEHMVSTLMQTRGQDSKQQTIKWFALLAGLGAGLLLVDYTKPVGYHSLAIMSFAISLSFLGYFFFLKRSEK